jgi:hypothetical protein
LAGNELAMCSLRKVVMQNSALFTGSGKNKSKVIPMLKKCHAMKTYEGMEA